MRDRFDPRIEAIVDALLAFARNDFSQKVPVSERLDEIDAIATGVNLLAEELDGAVASKREVEAAYRALQETQARLVHSEKLAAIGQLASGVAHEVNNPASWVLLSIGVLSGRVAELRRILSSPESDSEQVRARVERVLSDMSASLADASDGMERIRAVTQNLRTFSRIDGEEVERVPLCEVVRRACDLVLPALRHRARLVMELQDEVVVSGNRGRLGQVVTNLLVNAMQALTDERSADHEVIVSARRDGGWALVSVEDSGPGIPPALRERIFEPFFTTKPPETGTGLGLFLVTEIVKSHAGTVSVHEGRRGGARFEVRLPIAEPTVEVPREKVCAPQCGRLRLLLVDDEVNLLRTYAQWLGRDHDVKVAAGGQEALDVLAADPLFDVIVCDLQMPNVDGVAVYEQLVRRAPRLAERLVFCTGGVYYARIREFLERTRVPVLEKPVPADELLAALARTAAQSRSGS